MHSTRIESDFIFLHLTVILLFFCIFFNSEVWAAEKCSFKGPAQGNILLINTSKPINYIDNASVGRVLLSLDHPAFGLEINCPEGIIISVESAHGPINQRAIPTGIDGVSVELDFGGLPIKGNHFISGPLNFASMSTRLIQTGPIAKSQPMAKGEVATVYIRDARDSSVLGRYQLVFMGNPIFNGVACRPRTKTTHVRMKDANINEFKAVNTRLLAQPFVITLLGCSDTGYNVHYRLDTTTTIINSGVVALSADSTAKGIGIQVLDDNLQPMSFGNSYPTRRINNSIQEIRLNAAYFQLTGHPRPGTANTLLTLTLMIE